MRQKLVQVKLDREDATVPGGGIEVDDAYIGGEHHGGKVGCGASGKTPFVAAIGTDPANADIVRILRMKALKHVRARRSSHGPDARSCRVPWY